MESVGERGGRSRGWLVAFGLVVAAGVVLRLLYPGEVPWAHDVEEWWHYGHEMGHTEEWSWLGPRSSDSGWWHTGGGRWFFAALIQGLHIDTRYGLTIAVKVISALGLLIAALVALRVWKRDDDEILVWATALTAASAGLVIDAGWPWVPNLLTTFTILLLTAWVVRGSWWGAFAWGAAGPIAGMIHPSGFFTAMALLLVTVAADRKSIRWVPWLIGSTIFSLPLLPWAWWHLHDPHRGRADPGTWGRGSYFNQGVYFVFGTEWRKLSPVGTAGMILTTVAGAIGLGFLARKIARTRTVERPRSIGALAAIVGVLVPYVIYPVTGANFQGRYMTGLVPFVFAALAAPALIATEGRWRQLARGLLVAAAVVGLVQSYLIMAKIHRYQSMAGEDADLLNVQVRRGELYHFRSEPAATSAALIEAYVFSLELGLDRKRRADVFPTIFESTLNEVDDREEFMRRIEKLRPRMEKLGIWPYSPHLRHF